MTTPDPHGFTWRKSSYSASNGGCVEVGRWDSAEVQVRDTKNRTAGTLSFTAPQWRAFLTPLTALY